ncbi:copper resistance protein NlpE [Bacteroides sp.]|uniref:copper resistance protein NlpE n=1 Tax=Bacteroides sp. TaxID=29523 RepID=UPI003FA5312F
MKKFFYLSTMALCFMAMASCSSKTNTSGSTSSDSTQVVDMHTAETSLDYYGEYKGTTPAADCPGIEQTLRLNKDHTFTLQMIYLERKDGEFNESGTFSVEGNIATLTTKTGEESYYKIEEGRVVMLKADKQPVTGDLAEHYILKQEKVY